MSDSKTENLLTLIFEELAANKNRVDPSLMAGELSIILFLTEYNFYKRIEDDTLEQRLENVLEEFQLKGDISFAHGLCGFGWFLQHLYYKNLIEYQSVEGILFKLDELAYNYSISNIKNNNHDFLHGGVGNAWYLVSRLHFDNNKFNYLKTFADKLIDLGINSKNGFSWIAGDEVKDEIVTLGLLGTLKIQQVLHLM